MRIAVTGRHGQVARALAARATDALAVTTFARPAFDLGDARTIDAAFASGAYDVVVNAAAYTAVDKAESEPDLAMRVNGEGAGRLAEIAFARGLPLIHLSTDYVFDGSGDRPWREDDPVAPLCAYGRSKLAGEEAVRAAHPGAVVLRTAWVYSPHGQNFVRTMLKLGETREHVRVVADQIGNPTAAAAIADAVLAVARARTARPGDSALAGVFHFAGAGEAAWADFAEAIFKEAVRYGRPPVRVERIATADYPTAAARPKNSRLDCAKIADVYGVRAPDWRVSLAACIADLMAAEGRTMQA